MRGRSDRLDSRRLHLGGIHADLAHLLRADELSAEVILAQLRSIVADLLRITGMGSLESTDAIPPLRQRD